MHYYKTNSFRTVIDKIISFSKRIKVNHQSFSVSDLIIRISYNKEITESVIKDSPLEVCFILDNSRNIRYEIYFYRLINSELVIIELNKFSRSKEVLLLNYQIDSEIALEILNEIEEQILTKVSKSDKAH